MAKQEFADDRQVQVMYDLASSAADSGVAYSDRFGVRDSEVWNTHFEWDDDSTTYAAAFTLWASNKQSPGEADDTDWVEMVAAHGFDGLPGGDPTGNDGKDMVDISASGAVWYRWKVTRSAGSAVLQAYVARKERR